MTLEVTEIVGKSSGPANFTSMPTVAGDPVVESGSNTDGHWTRWSEGTQVCHHLVPVDYGSSLYQTFSHSQPFTVNKPGLSASQAAFSTAADALNVFSQATVIADQSQWRITFRGPILASSTFYDVAVSVVGRWK